jgi:hypothetical protein
MEQLLKRRQQRTKENEFERVCFGHGVMGLMV